MSDERRSEGGGAIVVIVVVLIVIGLLAIVGVGGGIWAFQRMTLARMQAEVAERQAVADMMQAEMLAKAAALKQLSTFHEVLLEIDAAGNFTFTGKPVTMAELPAALKQAQADHPDGVTLTIQSHPDAQLAHVLGAIDAAKNVGIDSHTVVTSPKPDESPQP